MARNTFGEGTADFVADPDTGRPKRNATVRFYDAETGGSQYTDLLVDGAPATQVTSGVGGRWECQGPDGVVTMWADAGGDRRFVVVATEVWTAAGGGGDVAAHEADTTDVHGISDTAQLVDAGQLNGAVAAATGGVSWIPLGDSLSTLNAGGAAGQAWPLLAQGLTDGKLYVQQYAGVAGETSAQVLARVPAVVAAAPDLVTLLAGPNDITAGVSRAEWSANVTAAVGQLRAAGITVPLCTIPPRSSAPHQEAVADWNAWLRRFARLERLPLLDFHSVLVDPATGALAYDYGDGLHISPPGHLLMAELVRDVLAPRLPAWAPTTLQWNDDPVSELADGLFLSGAPTVGTDPATGWQLQGAAVAQGVVDDGDFQGGKAWEVQSAAGTAVQLEQYVDTWSAGDVVEVSARVKVVDSAGVTETNGVVVALLAYNGAVPVQYAVHGLNVAGFAGVLRERLVVPTGATTVSLVVGVNANPGTMTVRFGELAVVNLSDRGLE